MKTINSTRFINWVGLTAIAILLGAVSAFAFYRQADSLSIQPSSVAEPFAVQAAVLPTLIPTESPVLVQAQQRFKPQTVTTNGIPVQLTYARILSQGEYQEVPNGVEFGFCYPTRNAGQWYFIFDAIVVNGAESGPTIFGWQPGKSQTASKQTHGRECGFVAYKLDPKTLQLPFTFTIREISVVPHEGSFCEEMKLRLASSAAADKAGILAKCELQADGSGKVTLQGHNATVSDAEAQSILDADVASKYVGPWVFTIDSLSQ